MLRVMRILWLQIVTLYFIRYSKGNQMEIRLGFVGDVLLEEGNVVIEDEVRDCIKSFDIFCGNLEGAVTLQKDPITKIGPCVKQKSDALDNLQEIGINLTTLANNHIFDYGLMGLQDTIDALQKKGISYLGAGTSYEKIYKEYIFIKGHCQIAFLNWAENGFGCAIEEGNAGYAWIMNMENFAKIREMKQQYDKVIILTHCGLEEEVMPLPEWKKLFHAFIDAGADVIINAHPHIVQGWETYKGGLIYYSLGNFIWNRKNSDTNLFKTYMVEVVINEQGEIKHKEIYISNDKGKISLLDDSEFEKMVQAYCNDLNNEEKYQDAINDMIERNYKGIYRKYYYNMFGLQDTNGVRAYLNNIICAVRNKIRLNKPFVYHNIGIETHNMVMKRYLLKEQKES